MNVLDENYKKVADALGCEPEVIKAIAITESNGNGFLPNGQPKILFEPYQFGRITKNKFNGKSIIIDKISYPLSLFGKWNRTRSKYGNGSIQYEKLEAAMKLNHDAAIESCSWGAYQVMGFNWKLYEYANATEFMEAMKLPSEQLNCLVKYLEINRLQDALKSKNWVKIAKTYNGSGYAQNKYDIILEKNYIKFKNTI